MATFPSEAIAYFDAHAIDPEVAADAGVRVENGAIVFRGERRRSLNGCEAKVTGPKGEPLAARWYREPSSEVRFAVICEGESDALAALSVTLPEGAQLPPPPILSIPGTGYPLYRLVADLSTAGVTEVFLALDGDDAGRRYTKRASAALRDAGIRRVADLVLPDDADLADVLVAADDRGDWLANAICDAEIAAIPDERIAHTSWAPVNLGPVLEGGRLENPPTMLTRTDGRCLLYPGKVHALVGEPETGKGWLALHASAERLRAGEQVLYIDFEDEAATAVSRLLMLGVEPETIARSFHYIRPDEPLGEDGWTDLAPLLARAPTLAVIDGVTEALTLHRFNLNDNADVATWLQRLPRPLQRTGAAVVLIDHPTKNREGRGGYALGAQHKKAGIDVAYELTVRDSFGRGLDGSVIVNVTKDRPGFVRPHARGGVVAQMRVGSDGGGAAVSIEMVPPSEPGPFRPTVLMERVSEAIENMQGLSKSAVRSAVRGKNDAKDLALERLIAEGYVRVEREGQAHKHFSVRMFRDGGGGAQ